MKNPRVSLHKVPGHHKVGGEIAQIIDDFLTSRPRMETAIFKSIGDKTKSNTGPKTVDIADLRSKIEDHLGIERSGKAIGPRLRYNIYDRWVSLAQDPDKYVPQWLRLGSGIGITKIPEYAGIFPESVSTTAPEDMKNLISPGESFVNYTSIEDSPHGEEVLGDLVSKGFVAKFTDESEVKKLLDGHLPYLSKLALITTSKDGVLKHRLILDFKMSGINDRATKTERIVLPSAWDVVHDSLAMSTRLRAGQHIKYLVLDFSDAFYMMPLWKGELRYCGAWYKGAYYIWLAIPQGSMNGPSVYGRLAALTNRMSQGLFDTTEVRSQLYVDDPCVTLRGDENRCRRLASILICFWLVLGWKLAYHKGQFASNVDWVGYSLSVSPRVVTAKIKEEFMVDLRTTIENCMKLNLLSIDELRSLAGRANHVATLVYTRSVMGRSGRHETIQRSRWQGMD